MVWAAFFGGLAARDRWVGVAAARYRQVMALDRDESVELAKQLAALVAQDYGQDVARWPGAVEMVNLDIAIGDMG